jgi:hypothetical protein
VNPRQTESLGGGTKKEVYGRSLQFRNRLKDKFEWDIKDDLNILMEEDPGRHPQLAANFPSVEMEDDPLDPVTSVDPEAAIDANLAAIAAAANSGISHAPGVSNNDNITQTVGPQNQNHQYPVTDDKDSDFESDDKAGLNNPPVVKRIDLADKEDEYVPEDGTTGYISITTAEEKRTMTEEERDAEIFHFVMTQFALKTGLKKFKESGEIAVTNELTQLHMIETFAPQDATKLTRKQRNDALGSLMFLKEKRNDEIKGRACVDGRKQHKTINKEDAASPTVATESVFIAAAIKAHKGRHVAYTPRPTKT